MQALQLVTTFFPSQRHAAERISGWLEPLRFFLRQIEQAGWCGIDWGALQQFEDWAEADEQDFAGEDRKLSRDWKYLVDALYFIPVTYIGFQGLEDGCLADDDLDAPLKLIAVLMDSEFAFWRTDNELWARFGGKPGPPFVWDQDRISAVWDRAEALRSEPEPICWFLDTLEFVCRETGNPFIDIPSHREEDLFSPWTYLWTAADIEIVRVHWAEAQSIRKRVEAFSAFAVGNEAWFIELLTADD